MRASVWILTLALVAVLSAAPVGAGETPLETLQALTATPAPAQADCGFNLEMVLPGKTSLCPAPQNAVVIPSLPALEAFPVLPEFMATRTCRCSCGYPCKTDADCGGAAGSCRSGITCC